MSDATPIFGSNATSTASGKLARRVATSTHRSGVAWVRRLKAYLSILYWLIREAMRFDLPHAAFAVLGNIVGVTLGVFAFGSAIIFVKILQKKAQLTLPVVHYHIRLDEDWLIYSLIATLLLGIAGAALLYASDWTMRRVARRYQMRFGKALLQSLSAQESAVKDDPYDPRRAEALRVKAACGDMRGIGIALTCAIQATVPLAMLVWSMAVLIWLDPVTALLLCTLSALYLLPLSWINRIIARKSAETEQLAAELKEPFTRAATMLHRNSLRPDVVDSIAAGAMQAPQFHRWLDTYDRRLLGKSLILSLNIVFLTICVIAVLVVGSRGILTESTIALMSYLVALKHAWEALNRLTQRLAVVSRFVASIVRVRGILGDARLDGSGLESPKMTDFESVGIKMRCSKSQVTGSVDRLLLQRGETAIALASHTLCRSAVRDLTSSLGIESACSTRRTPHAAYFFGGGGDAESSAAVLAGIGPDATTEIVYVSLAWWNELTPPQQTELRAAFSSAALVIVSANFRDVADLLKENCSGVSAIILAGENRASAAGDPDWFLENFDELRSIALPAPAAGSSSAGFADDDLDLE